MKAGKYPQVVIRVSVEDKKLIKKFDGNYADIWRLGFELWCEKIPSELLKKVEKYQKMLLQCNDKLAKCNDIVTTEFGGLEKLRLLYVKQRSVDNPNQYDISWIKARVKGIPGMSVEKFLQYCKNNGGKE